MAGCECQQQGAAYQSCHTAAMTSYICQSFVRQSQPCICHPAILASPHEHEKNTTALPWVRYTVETIALDSVLAVLQAGSMDFLASQGFDFNKFVYEGIPFMCVANRDRRLEGISREPSRSEISIHKPEDILFVAALVQQVSAWLQVSAQHSTEF